MGFSMALANVSPMVRLGGSSNLLSAAVSWLTDIIEILVGSIVPFAKGIGDGLSQLVQSLFLQTTGTGADAVTTLSIFGTVVIVFAGISLAIGLSRWVLNFITSLGARNR